MEQKIITEYKNGKHIHEIAKQYHKTERTVSKILKENNIPIIPSNRRELWFFPEQIVELYYQNYSSAKIGQIMGVTDRTIVKILHFHNIEIKKHGQRTFRDSSYFDAIDTEEKAYALGLLRSDGNISDNGTISLTQSSERKDLIEIAGRIFNVPVKYFEPRDEYYISFRQKKWQGALAQYGVVPRKSHEAPGIHLNKIPQELQHHYLRGLFDGDGLCYFNQGSLVLGFCSSFEEDVEEFFSWFDTEEVFKIYHGTVYFSSRSNLDWVNSFYEKIYKDATLFGQLKRERILERINK